jgi:hypothetical protein
VLQGTARHPLALVSLGIGPVSTVSALTACSIRRTVSVRSRGLSMPNLQFTLLLSDPGSAPRTRRCVAVEAVNDPDRTRQIQRFCERIYTTGHIEGDTWHPPHLIQQITWKEVDDEQTS